LNCDNARECRAISSLSKRDPNARGPRITGCMSGIERQALRATICVACLVPIGAGGAGILFGPHMAHSAAETADIDSHFRYLSGLLLAIGLGFASTVPRIERQGARFRLLACIVVLGGIGRGISLLAVGVPSPVMVAALAMELLVTPGLVLWQRRLAGVDAIWRDDRKSASPRH
jgi:uncharacterized membrane protein YfcA